LVPHSFDQHGDNVDDFIEDERAVYLAANDRTCRVVRYIAALQLE
jgi:hypothetical protein